MQAYGRFAQVYDFLMQDVDYDSWAAYLGNLLLAGGCTSEAGATILDCACGTGQVTTRLAQMGYEMIGLDVSEDMLRIALERTQELGIRIPFVCQDMREIRLHKPVDAIVCACDGVNYLTSLNDVRAFFEAAYCALKQGGLFLFDISSRYKLKTVLGNQFFGNDDQACSYIWKNTYDPDYQLIEMDLTCFVRQGTFYERFDETHVQRAHSVVELKQILQKTGFEHIVVYEAFTQQVPTRKAERLQWIAKKTNT